MTIKFSLLAFAGIMFVSFSGLSQSTLYKEMMNDPRYNFYDVCQEAETYFQTHDKGKGSGYINYLRWKAENESKFFPSGNRNTSSPDFAAQQFNHFVVSNPNGQRNLYPSGWKDLGPYSANNITEGYNPGIGRVEDFWVNPVDDQHIYLGSRSGGFWKTLDGGSTWQNTTDFLVASGVNTITVSPTNPDSILINVQNGGNNFTHGIYRSIDGGDTWTLSNFNPANLGWGGLGSAERVYKIAYHPFVPNLVFIGTSRGIFRSADNLQTWTQLRSSADITEIEFHPTNPDIIYLYDDDFYSAYQNNVLRSTDRGLSYTVSSGISGNGDASGILSVTPVAPNNLYFASTNGVWKSNDEGQTFTQLSTPSESCDGFAVSDVDSIHMIYGYLDIEASNDGGINFSKVTYWANTNPGPDYVHADLRIAKSVNGVFYVGTDGYLAKSSDNGISWERLNDGTGIREFYASGVGQSNYHVFMAGSQDNGTSIRIDTGWVEWNGGDGMEAIIHPLNPQWMMGSWQFGTRQITKDAGLTRQGAGNPDGGSGNAAWQAPLLFDPNNQMRVFHFAKKIYASDAFGDNWYEYADPKVGTITAAAIAENNSKIMAVSGGKLLKVTTDSWQTVRLAMIGRPDYYITDIAFDPNRDSTMVVTHNTYENNGEKVYLSTDLGLSWTNITYNLGDMPIRTVVIDHSDSSYIYVGAEIGVYVKSMNGTSWELYNPGLPNVTVKDLEIHYGSNTLKAATWGRGLWEYSLKDRNEYPGILTTSITNPPTEFFPRAGYAQYVTSTISYSQNLKSVYVLWSNDSRDLDNKIEMVNISDSTWKSIDPIKNFGRGTDIFFQVVAVGQNNDTSITYTYQYEVQQGLIINGVEEETKDLAIQVFPNPSKGQFTIRVSEERIGDLLEIRDIQGKIVYSSSVTSIDNFIRLDIPSGNYILKIGNDVEGITETIVIR